MSQAQNKVGWCLKKAEQEIKNTGRHRGLVKMGQDKDLALRHLRKAEHNLQLAYYVDKGGFSDWAASAFFYTLYHCCLAIAASFGYESRNQECTIALLESLMETGELHLDRKFIDVLTLAKDKELELSVIGKREEFQYGTDLELDHGEFQALSKIAKEMLEATKRVLSAETP